MILIRMYPMNICREHLILIILPALFFLFQLYLMEIDQSLSFYKHTYSRLIN